MKTWVGILFVFLVLTGAATLYPQNAQAPPPPSKLEKIADDMYVILGEGSNVTVYLTDEGVILVDSKFERNHDDIVAKVKTLTEKPIRYVINTHSHQDHTGGNPKMLPSAQIVGHVNLRNGMIKGKQPGPPNLTFTRKLRSVTLVLATPMATPGFTSPRAR
jgi:cyclase